MSSGSGEHEFSTHTLWILAGELNLEADSAGRAVLAQPPGHNVALLKYEDGLDQPKITSLRFELPERGYFSTLLPRLSRAGKGIEYTTPQGRIARYSIGPTVFQFTEDGFIVTGNYVPGFWLLPSSPSRAVPEVSRTHQIQDPTNSFFAAAEIGDLSTVQAALAQGMAV